MSLFGNQSGGPTKINSVQLNQSVLGYCIPVVMGRAKVQQTILWVDGFKSANGPSSGGKGFGGKGSNQLLYSADVIAGLCNGGPNGIVGIGDAWSGQSWLRNTDTFESYTIAGGSPSYTPVNAANMTADAGVGYSVALSTSNNDLGAPAPTTFSTSLLVAFTKVPYVFGGTLATGQYSVDPATNIYYFSATDAGITLEIFYSFALSTVTRQEQILIPSGLSIQVGDSSGGAHAIPWSADLGVTYYNTGSTNGEALTKVSGTPTVTGTYSVTAGALATYHFAPGDALTEIQLTWQVNNSNALPAGTQTSLSFEVLEGTPGQSPLALLASNYPGAAIGYTGVVLLAFTPMDLGFGAQIQQNSFEVLTADAWGSGIPDCNPVQCILQVLTNPVWGLGVGAVPFPLSAIDNGSGGTWGTGNRGHQGNGAYVPFQPPARGFVTIDQTATSWFAANGFFISPMIDKQDTAASVIGPWLEAGMCAAYISEGLVKLVPYGDTSVAANGATWTAPTSFDAVLDDSCFLKSKGADPVKISTPVDYLSAWNTVQVSWSNRANQYAPEVTPETDKAASLRYGSRIEDPQTWEFITTLAAATFAASIRVKRAVYTRNKYQFSLPFRYGYLESMGVVSITTSSAWSPAANNTLGITNKPVRITKIVDNPDGTYDMTAEDYLFGVQQNSGFTKALALGKAAPNQFADPGVTQAVVFVAPARLANYANQVWIGANGGNEDWGGTNVYASVDGVKYSQIGTLGPCRVGTLASALPIGTDPDTTDTLVVNLVPGSPALEAGTSADADQGNTLCYVDGEIVSYSACAISGEDQYTAGTYIRRGLMGSTEAAHAMGAAFMRLDAAVLKYTYDPSWAGVTVYLKFQAFNRFDNSAQDISTLTPVTLAVPGAASYTAVDPYTGDLSLVRGAYSAGLGEAMAPMPPTLTIQPPSASGTGSFSVSFAAYLNGVLTTGVTWSLSGGSVGSLSGATFTNSGAHGGAGVIATLTANPSVQAGAGVTW